MSLLMDALKRAEEAKRQTGQPNDPGLALEPRGDEKSPLPDLSSHLDAVNADLQAEAVHGSPAAQNRPQAPAAPTPAIAESPAPSDRDSARQVFAAKPEPPPRSNIPLLIGIGSLLGLAVTGYFGYQYMALTESANRLAPAGPIALGSAPRPAPITVVPTPPSAASPVAAPTEPSPAEPSPAEPSPADLSPADPPAPQAATVRRRPVRAPAARPDPSPEPRSAITVTSRASALEQALTTGYQAINAGDFDRASIAYQAALREDPNQVDAWLGLAAVAVSRDDPEAAAAAYLRALELDPRNANAHVGLLGLGSAGDLAQRESRLRSLLALQAPGSHQAGMLQFGLGNLYASQRRWSDAQQAFFAAHASDAGNPDYLYNLAVSLDRLQQPSLALKHYRAARAAVAVRPGAFDQRQLDARIDELSR